jgi:hypothetical protein
MLTYARLSGHNDGSQLPAPLPRIQNIAGRGASYTTSSTKRIRVEHGISHLKNRRSLSRHLGRREHLDTILPAVAGLVSSQEGAPRPAQLHRQAKALTPGTTR